MSNRYYEDFTVGETFDLGSTQVTEREIIEFAEKYDPQEFHLNKQAASETTFGELFASGWHTASLCMRQLVDGLLSETAVLSGIGVDSLRWKKPVFAGDELTVTADIANKEIWSDDRGVVTFALKATNQRGDVVIYLEDLGLVECRE